VESLLLEVLCPVCSGSRYYVDIKGKPNCGEKGCVHAGKAKIGGWQDQVKDYIKKHKRNKNDWDSVDKALRILTKESVPLEHQARTGIDTASVIDFHYGRHVSFTREIERDVTRELKKHINIKPYRRFKSDEGIGNSSIPSKINWVKAYTADFSPALNDSAIEKWAKKFFVIRLHLRSDSGNITLDGVLDHQGTAWDFKTVHMIMRVPHNITVFVREGADFIKSLYNNIVAKPKNKPLVTRSVTLKGNWHPTANFALPNTQLKVGDEIVGRTIPIISAQVGMGNINSATIYKVTQIDMITPTLPPSGKASVILRPWKPRTIGASNDISGAFDVTDDWDIIV